MAEAIGAAADIQGKRRKVMIRKAWWSTGHGLVRCRFMQEISYLWLTISLCRHSSRPSCPSASLASCSTAGRIPLARTCGAILATRDGRHRVCPGEFRCACGISEAVPLHGGAEAKVHKHGLQSFMASSPFGSSRARSRSRSRLRLRLRLRLRSLPPRLPPARALSCLGGDRTKA